MQQQEQLLYQEEQQFSAEPKVMQGKQRYREPQNQLIQVGKNSEQGQEEEEELEEMSGGVDEEVPLDFYLDQAPMPIFVPREKGEDKVTQIDKGDLFDYDLEVEPVIEIIIARLVEASRMELIEEDEALELKQQRRSFLQERNAELMKCQRMGNRQDRKDEERQRRKLQFDEQVKAAIAKQQMQLIGVVSRQQMEINIRHQVDLLDEAGVIRDSLQQKLEGDYYENLLNQVGGFLGIRQDITRQVDRSYRDIQSDRNIAHLDSISKENERRAGIIQDRENKAFLKEYRKQIKNQKKDQVTLQEERAQVYALVQSNILAKRANIDQTSLLECNLIEMSGAELMSEKGVSLLNPLVVELLLQLDLAETIIGKPLASSQYIAFMKAYLPRLKNPLTLTTNQTLLAEFNQDIQLNEDNNPDFLLIRQERLQYYIHNISQFNLSSPKDWNVTDRDLSSVNENTIHALIEILLEQKKIDEPNQNNSTSRIEKTKNKALITIQLEEEEEEKDNSSPGIHWWVNIQPVREFKQEESLQDTSKNDTSQRDLNNKSVNKSVNKSLNKSKEKEKEREAREAEERLLAEQLALQQEQEALLLKQQQEEQERIKKELEKLDAQPDSFENNQSLIDWHVAKIRRQFLLDKNERFTDIEYYDGKSYEKKCGNVPEQKISEWQTMNTQMVAVNDKRMVVVDNRAPVVIQQQMSILLSEVLPEFTQKEQNDLIDLYRPIYSHIISQRISSLNPAVIFDYDE